MSQNKEKAPFGSFKEIQERQERLAPGHRLCADRKSVV